MTISSNRIVRVGDLLTLDDVIAVARQNAHVELAEHVRDKITASRQWVDSVVSAGSPIVYGINTGFGIFANVQVSTGQARELMRRLIVSHIAGVGDPLPEEAVRAAMLVRANALAQGHSGVRVELIETLLEMLNRGVHPFVPAKGSVGASGDLAPLSYIALVMTRDESNAEAESGQALYEGERLSGKAAMERAGIARIVLEAKEGLALNNGTSVSAALAVVAAHDSRNLLEHAIRALALTLEAVRGASNAFDARIHRASRHRGQQLVAEKVRTLVQGSQLVDRAHRVQDAYSIRCAPQVIGAAHDALEYGSARLEEEINAATDNPLIFPEGGALSGGNFHGETVALVCALLSAAVSELGAISERRTFRLLDAKLNDGLPMMLVERGGLNSGLMMVQVTAAALVSDNKMLAHPDVVDSVVTSANQEDHVPMSMNAARHLREIVWNTERIVAIELLTAAQAIDLRLRNEGKSSDALGEGTREVFECIREGIGFLKEDRILDVEIERAVALIRKRQLSA